MIASPLPYLLESALCLGAFHLLYRLALRDSALFRWQRAFLVGSLALAALIPALHIPISVEGGKTLSTAWTLEEGGGPEHAVAAELSGLSAGPVSVSDAFAEWQGIIWLVYGLGFLWTAIKFGQGLHQVWQLWQVSQAVGKDGIRQLKGDGAPFSFFSAIFFPASVQTLSPERRAFVLAHERAHVRQGHSWDILLAESLNMVLWFYPAWKSFKTELRQVHEFLADAAAQRIGAKHAYSRLLLELLAPASRAQLSHAFATVPIKKRIQRLLHPGVSYRGRFWLGLPVAIGLLGIFACEKTPIQTQTPLAEMTVTVDDPLQESQAPSPPTWIKPIDGKITAGFGRLIHPILKVNRFHTGLDFKAALGTPVLATGPGTVILAGQPQKGGYGIQVRIQHPSGHITRYAHLQAVEVAEGQLVAQGELIGTCGNTGLSKGPHLHYEVELAEKKLNPIDFIGPLSPAMRARYSTKVDTTVMSYD